SSVAADLSRRASAAVAVVLDAAAANACISAGAGDAGALVLAEAGLGITRLLVAARHATAAAGHAVTDDPVIGIGERFVAEATGRACRADLAVHARRDTRAVEAEPAGAQIAARGLVDVAVAVVVEAVADLARSAAAAAAHERSTDAEHAAERAEI